MIQFEIKAPIGREYDGNEYTIKCMDPGVTFAVELFTVEPISPWRERAIPYQIPEGSTATLRVTRPDRAYTNTKTTIEGGIIFCPVHPYSVATPGKCSADVAVYGPDGNRITSATFHFFVDRECAPTAGENAPVFVDSIQGLIEFVEQSAERAEAAADRAESSGGGNGGNPPKDGITPHIGANGNWYIGTTDTGVSAEGVDGEDGGHYTPVVTQPTTDTIKIAFTPSKATMPAVAPVTVQLPAPSESNGAGEHPDNPVVDGITVGGENGVRLDSEGEPSTPVLALYGAQGDEPVRVSHVAPAQEDGEAVPLGQVKQLVKEHTGQNVAQNYYLLKSPNGTIFKLTVTDGGALQVVGTVEDEGGVLDDLVPGRLLAWHDEFETLDTTTWGYEEGHVRAAHVVYFEAAEKNVFVKDSCVHFKALRDNPTEDYEWSAGGLGTDINIGNGFTFVNGLLEFKVKIPVIGSGRWATIWCLGAINKKTTVNGTTATRGLKSSMCGEIDIMDYVGGAFPLVYYSQDIYNDMFDTYNDGLETLTQNEWHILGIEKSTNELIFYVDREEKGRLDLTGIESFNDKAFNIKMNCVVGGASGTIADDMTEMEMIVDWVRYYLPQSESEISTELTASIGMTEFALNKGMNRAIYPQFNTNAANAFVEWYSSDPSVATAYGGYIKALKNGATTITGKDNDGNTLFEAQLTVSDDAYNPVGRIVATDIPEMLQYNMPVKLSYLCYPEYATSKVAVASCSDAAVTCDGDTITLTESLTVDRTATITLSNAEGNVSTSFEVTLHKNVSLDLSDTTGLLAEYNQTGMTYTNDVKNVDWADNKGNCNTIKLRSGGSTKLQEWTVNGLQANHANVYKTSERFIQTAELDAFTMLVYADITAQNSIFGVNGNTVAPNYGGVAVTNVNNARFALAEIADYSVDKLALLSVYILRRNTDGYQVGYYNGTEVVWSATANPAASETVNTNTALGSAKAGGQLAQGLYKHIALYNIAKTDDEVKAICEELYGMYQS